MSKIGLKIFIVEGPEITAQDEFKSEEHAIEQASNYGTTGYYSRIRKVYYPPHQIKHIQLITINENKP